MRRRAIEVCWLGMLSMIAATCGAVAVGCGGDDSATIQPTDDGGADGSALDGTAPLPDGAVDATGSDGAPKDSGGGDSGLQDSAAADSSSQDSAADAPADAPADVASDAPADAPSDAAPSCGADNTPCSNNGADGLCKSMVCSACTDPTDDSNCKAAYGNGGSPSWLCLSGTCTPGDCRTNADCANNPNGGLCGVSTPNFCGKCTSDSQCSGATPVCNTTTGQCVTGTCTPNANNPPATCSVNANDMCCTGVCQPSTGANACCPGASSNAYCTGKLGVVASCVNNVCTACPVVSNGQYVVDPVNGSDSAGTGAGTQGCAFKTITRALQVIGSAPALPTTISIAGPSTVSAGETFPIALPTNVTVTSSGGAVTISVPAGKSGFTLSKPLSGISGGAGAALTISGSSTATVGVVATTGSTSTTQLANVTISDFLNAGILVNGSGVLSIGAGVTSTANGTSSNRSPGLHVTGSGNAIVNVPAGSTPTHFDGNTSHGILVDGTGYLTLTGSVTNAQAGEGTVTANGNFVAGLWIGQTPGNAVPQNVITGLVSYGTTNGNGMRFLAGSNVKLRNSASLAAVNGSGIDVSFTTVSGVRNNDVSKIDLGAAGDPGNNYVQNVAGAGNNGAAGICLDLSPNSGTLKAQGNQFRTANCASQAAQLTANKKGCGNAACAGGLCDVGYTSSVGNTIDTTMCTQP